jgi:hypothetical protein
MIISKHDSFFLLSETNISPAASHGIELFISLHEIEFR